MCVCTCTHITHTHTYYCMWWPLIIKYNDTLYWTLVKWNQMEMCHIHSMSCKYTCAFLCMRIKMCVCLWVSFSTYSIVYGGDEHIFQSIHNILIHAHRQRETLNLNGALLRAVISFSIRQKYSVNKKVFKVFAFYSTKRIQKVKKKTNKGNIKDLFFLVSLMWFIQLNKRVK